MFPDVGNFCLLCLDCSIIMMMIWLTCWYVGQLPELLVVASRETDETLITVALVEILKLLIERLTGGTVEWQILAGGQVRQVNIRAEGRFADHFHHSLRVSQKWPHRIVIVVFFWIQLLLLLLLLFPPWLLSLLDIEKIGESSGCDDDSTLVPVRNDLCYEGWEVDVHCCQFTIWEQPADWPMFTSRRARLTRPWRPAVNSGQLGTPIYKYIFDQGVIYWFINF